MSNKKKVLNAEIIFIALAIITILASYLFKNKSFYVLSDGEMHKVVNLLNYEGLNWIFSNTINNFKDFPVLPMVIVATLGVGLAEETKFLQTLLHVLISKIPNLFLTPLLLFAGVIGNLAGSVAFAVIPPLGGMLFKLAKRNPLLGIVTGFGGVAAGLSANLFIAPTDVLVSGITESACKIIDRNCTVLPTSNWYFFVSSTFFLVILGTIVIEYIMSPILNKYNLIDNPEEKIEELDERKLKALKYGAISIIIYVFIIILLKISILSSIIPLITLLFFIPSLIFGIIMKVINSTNDIFNMMYKSIRNLSGFIVLCFFASQFIGIFKKTNLGLFIATNISNYLKKIEINLYVFILLFLIFIVIMDLFIGSMSAKWIILAPVFVPLFMKLGFSAEFAQVCYRISDSITNAVSPLEPFMPFILVCIAKYTTEIDLKELIKIMLPLSISFFIIWIIQLFIWIFLNIPLGPHSGIFIMY